MKRVETKSLVVKFANTMLTLDEETGRIISTEVDKKGAETVTDFTEILEEFIGVDGVNVTIGTKDEVVGEE